MAANSALKLLGSVHKNWVVVMEVVPVSPCNNFHETATKTVLHHASFVSSMSKLVSFPCPQQQQQQRRSFSSHKSLTPKFSSLPEMAPVKVTEQVPLSCSSRFFSSSVFGRKHSWRFQLWERKLGSVTRLNNVRLLASCNGTPVFGGGGAEEEEEEAKPISVPESKFTSSSLDGSFQFVNGASGQQFLEESGSEERDCEVELLANGSLKEEEEEQQQQQQLLEERPLGSSGTDPYLWENQFLEDSAKVKRQPKPMCYYFTQGLCTLMEDVQHMGKFSHLHPDLPVRATEVHRVKKQPFNYYLVLDLEGMVEILEFPIIVIDARTLKVVDRFHRFVRPVKMTEARQAEYVSGKYGRWGLDRVWHDTAIPFTEVLKAFEDWLKRQELWEPHSGTKLKDAAFVTCGNWDVKTKIPEQCETSGIDLPPYFNEWINLKDIYLNFYKQRAGGMLAMLRGLKITKSGTHHLGLDDALNIARVVQRMLSHGAILKITAKRKAANIKAVRWTFQNRIK